MRIVPRLLGDLRTHYSDDPDLMRIVVNAMSWVEAGLALGLLGEKMPEKALVAGANIREAIKEMPRCPICMAVEFETLSRVAGLERVGSGWERTYEDPEGDYTIVLLGEGNYCYDIVVRTEGRAVMWMPHESEEDFLNPDIVDLIMGRTTLLANVIDLVGEMGLPFSPIFYMSLEDWSAEYAETLFGEVCRLFGEDAEEPHRARTTPREERSGVRGRQPGTGSSTKLTWAG